LKPQPSPVKQLALGLGTAVLQPANLKEAATLAAVKAATPDALVVAAYGLLLPAALLDLPPRGCLNIHASLLPRWRGAAPIQRALLAGDVETGITIMQMDRGLDTGPILRQAAIAIAPEDTAGSLHDKLAQLGAQLILRELEAPSVPRRQESAAASHAPKLERREQEIDWRAPAATIERQVRALNPAPGAHTSLAEMAVKIWRVRLVPGLTAAPGAVFAAGADGIGVGCGAGAVQITELQRAGGKRLPAQAFLAGCPVAVGARFGRGDA
jgi:methionyl-tRNA formyltransferase